MYDTDYHNRINMLAELMECHPDSRMKSLQKTALREYPVSSRELYRHCMGYKFAFKAADIANSKLLVRCDHIYCYHYSQSGKCCGTDQETRDKSGYDCIYNI